MVPDPDLQLQVVIKALSETIAPAVRSDEKVAQEQLHLSIATLGILRQQLPMTRRYLRRLADDAIALADRLAVQIPERWAAVTAGASMVVARPSSSRICPSTITVRTDPPRSPNTSCWSASFRGTHQVSVRS